MYFAYFENFLSFFASIVFLKALIVWEAISEWVCPPSFINSVTFLSFTTKSSSAVVSGVFVSSVFSGEFPSWFFKMSSALPDLFSNNSSILWSWSSSFETIEFSTPKAEAISPTELVVSEAYSFVSWPILFASLARFLPWIIAIIAPKEPTLIETVLAVAL